MRILISPLDWGLGHATRCVPVIRSFLQNGCEVLVACNATQQRLLVQEFTSVTFLQLDGYDIRYSSSKRWFAIKILQQIPKITRAVRREHNWLKQAVKRHKIDIIISDNRYGFYHRQIPSFFITHQLFIQTPYKWLSGFIQKINYKYINRFAECWVPDYEGHVNIAGSLSHPKSQPVIPVHYIGLLSRFTKKKNELLKYKWLIILSGPEPQRTLLESALPGNFPDSSSQVLLIRGLPSGNEILSLPQHFTVYNHLPAEELQQVFLQSEYIISRSGYSTVMDIIALGKKSILIPTPGQTEQEYLAKHLMLQQWCMECKTPNELGFALTNIEQFPFQLPQLPEINLDAFIKGVLNKHGQKK